MDEFDSIIIGSGQAAPSLAVALAKRGELRRRAARHRQSRAMLSG